MSIISYGRMRRLPGFDALRFWMIVCVVCLHGAMSYMLYAPGYWYVKNPEGSGIFTMLVVLLDAFPMSALFFLSGYFALPSYNKKGCGEFLREKAMRVGLPWLLGTLLVAPFFAYASMLSLGLPLLGPGDFLGGFFWGAGYQQGVYWFLGLLLLFLGLFALGKKMKISVGKSLSMGTAAGLLALGGSLCYLLSVRFVMDASSWLNAGFILYFQPARLASYGGMFALGVHAFRTGRFLKGGRSRAWRGVLTALAAVSGSLILARLWLLQGALSPLMNDFLDALSYNLFSLAMTLLLLSHFSRKAFQKGPAPSGSSLFRHSFTLYWFHLPVLMLCVFLLIPVAAPIFLKWLASVSATTLTCVGMSALLKRKLRL